MTEISFKLNEKEAKLSKQICDNFSRTYSVNGARTFQISTSYEFSSSGGIGTNVYMIVNFKENGKPDVTLKFDITDYESW